MRKCCLICLIFFFRFDESFSLPCADSLTPAAIIQQHEAAGRTHRVADRALAVLELADMKTDHDKREEATVLYKRGLECLADAIALVKSEPHEEWYSFLFCKNF